MTSATCRQRPAASWSPHPAAAAALARALAWNSEIDLDTLNVASHYRSGVLTCAFACTMSCSRRSAAACGSAASRPA